MLPWVALLGWLTSVAWFITDDAFISFRYVRNLLDGHGLVFNPGEYVEGYTNFLWVLELAAIWRLFGLRPEARGPVAVGRLHRRHDRRAAVVGGADAVASPPAA